MRQLLARPPGWVLPPEPGDPVARHPPALDDSSRDHRPLDDSSFDQSPLDRRPLDHRPLDNSSVDHGSLVAPAGKEDLGDLPDVPVSPPAVLAVRRRTPDDQSPTTEPADRVSGLLGLLPIAVRSGRLDPGRRGAAALVLVAVLAAAVAGGVVLRGRPQEVAVPRVLVSGSPLPGSSTAPDPKAEVVVAVAGTVARPGLVRLPAGSRVADAVEAAGGLAPGAGTGLLNLARLLVDGEQVLVGIDPPPAIVGGTGGGAGSPAGGLVDLNTATVADLDALPGIGPVLAQRIVDWRTENKRFASVDQLREVTGIGEAKYDDLAPKVTV